MIHYPIKAPIWNEWIVPVIAGLSIRRCPLDQNLLVCHRTGGVNLANHFGQYFRMRIAGHMTAAFDQTRPALGSPCNSISA